MELLQLVIGGLANGCIYGLVALGFVLPKKAQKGMTYAFDALAVAELEQRVSELEGQLRDAQQQATEKAESPTTRRAGSPQIENLLLEKSVPLTVSSLP